MQVKLTYFKESGAYYGSGGYDTEKKDMWEIHAEVRDIAAAHELPDLCKDHGNFIVLVEVPEHEYNVPQLLLPEQLKPIMKTQLIRINRSSIKKNPDANCTHYMVPGMAETIKHRYVRHTGSIRFEKWGGGEIVDGQWRGGSIQAYQPISGPQSDLSQTQFDGLVRGDIEEVVVKMESTRAVRHMRLLTPEPEYLFEYEDTEIECRYCHEKFPRTQLQEKIDDCGDDDVGVCPRCGRWDCCDLKFEDLDDVVKELEKENKCL